MAYQVFDNELRLMAKRANQRMVELEKRGLAPSSYQAAQSKLAYLGRPARNGVRRFSETGKGTRAEITQMKKQLRQFLGSPTTTISGLADVKRRTVESAKERFGDFSKWMTDDEYMQIWENLPDDEQDRVYGSDETVQIVSSVLKTQRGMKDEQAFTVSDIVNKLQESSSLKSALRGLGLEPSATLKNLGAL